MNKWIDKFSAEMFLRLGLGAMYVYSGYDLIVHPTSWFWALRGLPVFLQQMIDAAGKTAYLQIQGAGEIVLALIFLLWFLPRRLVRVAAFLAAVEMAAILIMVVLDGVTFRDIGLLGAALALWIMPEKKPVVA
ncbi:MAG: hypothetical protein AAB539_04285 [Patescibacteria group bacterium]